MSGMIVGMPARTEYVDVRRRAEAGVEQGTLEREAIPRDQARLAVDRGREVGCGMCALPTAILVDVKCVEMPATFEGHDLFLAVQKDRAVEDITSSKVKTATFTLEFRLADANGTPNFLGPYAQGTKQERFFYLAWGTGSSATNFGMFRRLKVHLSHLTWAEIQSATKARRSLQITLHLTDPKGGPRCASVRPGNPGVSWRS